jgi:hypothetical protein
MTAIPSGMDNRVLVPATPGDIEAVRRKCRRMVTRRAAVSAGMAVVPVPGLDIAADIGMLTSLIEQINAEFGLTSAQIERLQPTLRIAVYEMLVGMGSVLIGKVVTRELVARLLKRFGTRMALKHSARLVPVAGQAAAAALGFAAFRTIGFQHIDACTAIAAELIAREAAALPDRRAVQ